MIRWVTIFVLLVLLAFTSWFYHSFWDDNGAVKIKDRGKPDSEMWNFTRTEMDENGMPKARLKAVHMQHFPLDDSIEFDKPRMEIFNEDGSSPWFITAERGWLSGDSEKLLLYGDVYIWRYSTGYSSQIIGEGASTEQMEKEIEMITTDLKLLLEEEYAETENFVTIINKDTKITATGMQFNLKERHLKLLNKVKGRYEKLPAH